eukprot:7194299-Pyramimonas_sp.AAC.1
MKWSTTRPAETRTSTNPCAAFCRRGAAARSAANRSPKPSCSTSAPPHRCETYPPTRLPWRGLYGVECIRAVIGTGGPRGVMLAWTKGGAVGESGELDTGSKGERERWVLSAPLPLLAWEDPYKMK